MVMRLFEVDTLNQMIDGELVEDAPTPATWLWTSRYYLHDGVMNGDQFAVEAWERQTHGGMRISILPTRVSDDPWGMGRFRELLPLNLVSYEDRGNGKWY